jgi:hypothetical protein
MYNFDLDDVRFEEIMDQDSAVLEALERVDRGLFDNPESKDEDLEALYEH